MGFTYDYLNGTGSDVDYTRIAHIYIDEYKGEPFIPSSNFTMTKLSVFVQHEYNIPPDISFYFKLKGTNGFPSGTLLASGILLGSDISSSLSWKDITPTQYNFLSGTNYCIWAESTGVDATRSINWAMCAGGSDNFASTNGGTSWFLTSGGVYDFGEHGFILNKVLTVPTATGYMRYTNGGTNYNLRLITSGDAVSYNDDQTVRINNGGVYCADLVSGTDPDASGIFIKTPKGTKSWRTGS